MQNYQAQNLFIPRFTLLGKNPSHLHLSVCISKIFVNIFGERWVRNVKPTFHKKTQMLWMCYSSLKALSCYKFDTSCLNKKKSPTANAVLFQAKLTAITIFLSELFLLTFVYACLSSHEDS